MHWLVLFPKTLTSPVAALGANRTSESVNWLTWKIHRGQTCCFSHSSISNVVKDTTGENNNYLTCIWRTKGMTEFHFIKKKKKFLLELNIFP